MDLSSRDLRRAASQRLATADFLARAGFNLDAMYLAGYAVECALKSLILHLIAEEEDRAAMFRRISSGARMHYPEALGAILKEQGRPIPVELATLYRRYNWSTDLRYATGRRSRGEARGLLKMARSFHEWAEGEMS